MKHIKSYENINKTSKPKIGDYAIVNIVKDTGIDKELKKELEENIGIITDINTHLNHYTIRFNNIKKDKLHRKTFIFVFTDILNWSDNKETLETLLQQNKYNL